MTIRYPPRREPRVLALQSTADGVAFAVADPWVVRGAGRIECQPRARLAAIVRLVRREKPTALVTLDATLKRTIRRVGRAQGLPVVVADTLPRLPVTIARQLYPELPVLAPRQLEAVAASAISAVLHAAIPPRTYAPRRHSSFVRRAQ